jgi:hypothetical protein
VFGPTTDDDIQENAFFLWCFDKVEDYPCVYTPAYFHKDFVNWDKDVYKPYLNEWQAVDPNSDDSAATYTFLEFPSSKDAVTDDNLEQYEVLFASMVCKWGGYSDEECTFAVGGNNILYKSQGTEDGVVVDTSDRYANRFCETEDLDEQKWTGSSQDYDVQWTVARFDGRPLCDDEHLTASGSPYSMFPFQHNDRSKALAKSNTAYFISIIVVQWADLMICKTRSRSLFEQGMTNVFMNWSLFFETVLGAFLCYIPLAHTVVKTEPLSFLWWTPAIPFSITIYAYDELRKGIIRKYPGGWLQRNTYW